MNRKVIGALAAILVLGGFGFLMWGGLGSNLVYFLTPSELLARGDAAYETPVRLGGKVVPGSVDWNAEALDLRFRVTDGTDTLDVQSTGAPPAMFKDTMGVVIEGSYQRGGVFKSTNLLVQHSNEYKAPPEGHRPVDTYKTLIREDGQS
ncbi:MAG: cytochrome c maturation protein CcmE [Gemmatimonadota bacterium]